MENKIDISKLLKDCPRGMELDCTMYEDVCFDYVDELNIIHCYIQHEAHKTSITFNQHGTPNSDIKSKCVIFPKGKTTWEGFVPPCKFKDGDIVTCTNDACTYTAIFKEMIDKGAFCHYGVLVDNKFRCRVNDWSDFNETCRLATEEEKEQLFEAIKDNGYTWNAETKTLEKLIKPKFKVGDRIKHIVGREEVATVVSVEDLHYNLDSKVGTSSFSISLQREWELVPNKFDITTLKPFESKVLVRDYDYQYWRVSFFGYFDKFMGKFDTVRGVCIQCIPYEGNEHLLNTTNDCDEFYKTWK